MPHRARLIHAIEKGAPAPAREGALRPMAESPLLACWPAALAPGARHGASATVTVVAPLGAQVAGALAPLERSASVATATWDAWTLFTVAASVEPLGAVGVTFQPESPSKKRRRSPALEVETDGDVELVALAAASTGAVVFTPENATVTIEVCPATESVAVGALWPETATVSHTTMSVQFATESTLVHPVGHEIVTPLPEVSMSVTSTSPAAVPDGSAVCGDEELADAKVVAAPTWVGVDELPPDDVVVDGGAVVVVLVVDVGAVVVVVVLDVGAVVVVVEVVVVDPGASATVTVVAPLGAQVAGGLAPAERSCSVATAVWDAWTSFTVAASVDPLGAVGVTFQPESPSKNSRRSPAWEVVTDGDVEFVADAAASTGAPVFTPENAVVIIDVCPATVRAAVGAV